MPGTAAPQRHRLETDANMGRFLVNSVLIDIYIGNRSG
jgi:hypothetical protein